MIDGCNELIGRDVIHVKRKHIFPSAVGLALALSVAASLPASSHAADAPTTAPTVAVPPSAVGVDGGAT